MIKPMIPRRVQLALRRQFVLRKRRQCTDIWPILETAGRAPEGWRGWPEGKRFALVLTHDVDTAKGHDNCLRLADLEEARGFRSSFNLVPERYKVSLELRNELLRRGFEVGIHGLVHDGKLFSSRKIFEERAEKINGYLKEWGCSGFRSPAMHHNLEWIGKLNVQYDASTFDTDPFEPQPDGMGTIFPFLVYRKSEQALMSGDGRPQTAVTTEDCGTQNFTRPGRARHLEPSNQNPIDSSNSMDSTNPTDSSNSMDPIDSRDFFVELPYTLVQDFTLFILMREKGIDIWKSKLDWVESKAGMALINVHPDYLNFGYTKLGTEEYPARYYAELLDYVKQEYNTQYWHVLPRELARFWANHMSHHRTNPDLSGLKFNVA